MEISPEEDMDMSMTIVLMVMNFVIVSIGLFVMEEYIYIMTTVQTSLSIATHRQETVSRVSSVMPEPMKMWHPSGS